MGCYSHLSDDEREQIGLTGFLQIQGCGPFDRRGRRRL